jgi:hypothetical protein
VPIGAQRYADPLIPSAGTFLAMYTSAAIRFLRASR